MREDQDWVGLLIWWDIYTFNPGTPCPGVLVDITDSTLNFRLFHGDRAEGEFHSVARRTIGSYLWKMRSSSKDEVRAYLADRAEQLRKEAEEAKKRLEAFEEYAEEISAEYLK